MSFAVSALVALLSLGLTEALVTAGRGLPPHAVTGATNATPIVLSVPDLVLPPGVAVHGVVASVGGNGAANGTLVLTSVDGAGGFALSAVAPDGTSSPVAGSGSYTGGGTVTLAFTDGRILIGQQRIFEQSAPPRVVFVPRVSKYSVRSMSSPSNVVGAPSAEMRAQWAQRSVATDRLTFEVHVWGQATPTPDPDLDFDATIDLAHQLIATTHLMTVGRYTVLDGQWSDQAPRADQITKAGHEHVFGLAFETPILDQLLPFVPPGTKPSPTSYLQPADGSPPEIGCQG